MPRAKGGLLGEKVVERGDSLPNRQLISVLASEADWCRGIHCCGHLDCVCEVPEFVLDHGRSTAPGAAAVCPHLPFC